MSDTDVVTCPACSSTELEPHCDRSGAPPCGWARCRRGSCRAAIRLRDRHVMGTDYQP